MRAQLAGCVRGPDRLLLCPVLGTAGKHTCPPLQGLRCIWEAALNPTNSRAGGDPRGCRHLLPARQHASGAHRPTQRTTAWQAISQAEQEENVAFGVEASSSHCSCPGALLLHALLSFPTIISLLLQNILPPPAPRTVSPQSFISIYFVFLKMSNASDNTKFRMKDPLRNPSPETLTCALPAPHL